MARKKRKSRGLKVLIFVLLMLFALEVGFLAMVMLQEQTPEQLLDVPVATQPEVILPETTEATEPVTAEPETTVPEIAIPEITVPETEPPTEAPTEPPQPETFVLTFVGDCTLGSEPDKQSQMYQFVHTIGTDYDYPFRNVVQYFENDDLTFANLEGNFTDQKLYSDSYFSFRGPTAFTQILTGSSVEAVTLANNHTMDFGQKGYQDTVDALDEAGLSYVEDGKTMLYTTERGLTVGFYAANFKVNLQDLRTQVTRLRSEGADIVVMAIHWGSEGYYRPNAEQIKLGHDIIDCGVDIVYGSHPHVLQYIEEYGDGVIYYSMGNFSFGGNTWPRDRDSVILQQEVIREPDGTVHLGELTRIPVCISSIKGTDQNNFQPTPYEEGSKEYERTLSKLDGTFDGPNLIPEYN